MSRVKESKWKGLVEVARSRGTQWYYRCQCSDYALCTHKQHEGRFRENKACTPLSSAIHSYKKWTMGLSSVVLVDGSYWGRLWHVVMKIFGSTLLKVVDGPCSLPWMCWLPAARSFKEEILSFPPKLKKMTQYYSIKIIIFGKCFKIFCMSALAFMYHWVGECKVLSWTFQLP